MMLKTEKAENSGVVWSAGAVLLSLASGFLLSGSSIAGVASFANISLAGAVSLPSSAAVLTGSILRYIVAGNIHSSIVQLFSIILIVLYKLFFESSDAKANGIFTGASVMISGAAVSLIIGELLYKLLFYAVYSSAAGFTAYCTSLVTESLRRRRVLDLSSALSCEYAVVYIMAIASFCSADVPLLNPGVIIGSAVTLTAACHYRYTGGVLCGALTMCGAFLASLSCGMNVIFLPAAGLITGYMSKKSTGTAAALFIGISAVFTVFSDPEGFDMLQLLNIIAGAAVSIAVSPRFPDKWVSTGRESEHFSHLVSLRLGFLANSIGSIRSESVKISEMLSKNGSVKENSEENGKEVCKHCHKRLGCWYNSAENTRRGFKKLSELVEITRETFPYELDECLHKDELSKAFEKSARERMTEKLLAMNVSDSRKLLFEQIKITEQIISEAGVQSGLRYSDSVSGTVREKLMKFGFNPKAVTACYNNSGRLLTELYFAPGDAPKNCERLCDLIADELRLDFDFAEPVCSHEETRIRIFERPVYELEAYGSSVCSESSVHTGDSSIVFSDGTGVSYAVISDGMGSGREAALQSKMVISMFKRLITSGVSCLTAIKLINSIMLTKSRDEAFATFDAVRIDLDTSELTVIKSGASATLLRHKGQVLKITAPTFPIGIVEEADTFSENYEFDENDIIIMFSDGISENEYRFIKELLLSSNDLKHIVEEICAKAELFNQGGRADDITVIGARLIKSE